MKKIAGISKIYLDQDKVKIVIVFTDSEAKIAVELKLSDLNENTLKGLNDLLNLLLKDATETLK